MLEHMPYPTGQRPPRRRRVPGPVGIDDLHDMLNRPTVTCEDCGTTYWEGFPHTICNRRPKEEFL
jgi:hypothetical protein